MFYEFTLDTQAISVSIRPCIKRKPKKRSACILLLMYLNSTQLNFIKDNCSHKAGLK